MTKVAITIEIDMDDLPRYTDEFLATAWHVAQANPAPNGDPDAAELVKHIGWEIIGRWLRGIRPEMYHHQADANYHQWLTAFANYQPPDGWRQYRIDPADPVGDFHYGKWVPGDPAEVERKLAKLHAAADESLADRQRARGDQRVGGLVDDAVREAACRAAAEDARAAQAGYDAERAAEAERIAAALRDADDQRLSTTADRIDRAGRLDD